MNTSVNWDVSPNTIVRKASEEGSQTTIDKPNFKRMKEGEQMNFDAHVNVEAMPHGKHLKKATIFSNVPNEGAWEIISDEGKAIGGRGSAPSPIMYFATGAVFCMMSHVEMLAHQAKIDVKARLEQKAAFTTTLNFGGIDPKDVFGKGVKFTINLILETDEPEDRMLEFVEHCIQACMSLQTVMEATPVAVGLQLNESPIIEVGQPESVG